MSKLAVQQKDTVVVPKGTEIVTIGKPGVTLAKKDRVVEVHHTLDEVTLPARWALNMAGIQEVLLSRGIDLAALEALRLHNHPAFIAQEIVLEPQRVVWIDRDGGEYAVAKADVRAKK